MAQNLKDWHLWLHYLLLAGLLILVIAIATPYFDGIVLTLIFVLALALGDIAIHALLRALLGWED